MLRLLLALAALCGPALAQLCDQPFSPTRAGWEWQYRVSGERPSTYTVRKTAIADGGYTQIRTTAGQGAGTEQTKFRCTAEGLFPVDIGGSGNVRAEQAGGQPATYDLEVIKVTGVAIPDYDTWAVGNSWKLVIEVKGTGSQGPIRFNLSGTLETTYKVAAQEAVTTPAGRFTAYRLQTTFATKIRATAGPVAIPVNFDSEGTSWYAEGVGLVKSIQKTRNGETTTELVALRK